MRGQLQFALCRHDLTLIINSLVRSGHVELASHLSICEEIKLSDKDVSWFENVPSAAQISEVFREINMNPKILHS